MMKMFKKNMFKAVLFLLSTVLMIAWVSTAVIAGGEPPYALTLQIDTNTIDSCYLTVKDRSSNGTILVIDGQKYDQLPVSSGQTYRFPSAVDVFVKVIPKQCYSPTLKDQVGSGSLQGSTMHWDNFNEDFSATITGTPRTYNVFVLDYDKDGYYGDGLGGLNYEIAESSTASGWFLKDLDPAAAKLKYTFLDENLTELPVVKKDGYDFKGWNVIIGADNTSTSPADYDRENGKCYIPSTVQSSYFDVTNVVYVYPVMEPIKYPIYRYDYVYDASAPEGSGFRGNRLSIAIPGEAPMNSEITGLLKMDDDLGGIYKQYPGYLLMDETQYNYDKHASVKVNKPWGEGVTNTDNIIYRMYQAIVYELVFLDDNGLPLAGYNGKTYSYATRTEIPDPTRTGYTFCGWTVEVYKNGGWETHVVAPGFVLGGLTFEVNEETGALEDPNAIYASEKNPEGKYEIRLTANWTPNVYDIEYDWNVGGNDDLEAALEALNPSLPLQFTFDSQNAAGEKKLAIANAIRNGYTFDGWRVEIYTETDDGWKWVQLNANGEFPKENESVDPILNLSLYTALHACDVRLTANWTPHKYSVNLNAGDGVADGYTPSIDEVEFDKPLTLNSPIVCPQKTGFTFRGYFDQPEGGKQYINAEGESMCDRWDIYADTNGATITLYAQWSRNSYDLTVDVNELPAGTVIEIVTADGAHYPYTDAPISLPYRTSFTVAFIMPEGYKLVKWNGDTVVHTNAYTSASLTIGAEDRTVTAIILPVATVPAVTPDYLPENAVLDFAADGEYILSVEDMEDIVVTIQNGVIRINGERADAVVIPEEYFGKTVSIVYRGDGAEHADSYPVELDIAARPEAPAPEKQLYLIDNTDDRKLTVYMYEGLSYVYEFAISRTNDIASVTEWFSNGTGVYTFTDLQPGTAYYIFIRTKATSDAPHGQVYITRNPCYTPTKDYVDETIDDLNSLIGEDDGDITSALIQGAIDQINQWASQEPLPETFYADVEALIDRIKNEQLAFAQSQDAKIAALEKFLNECLASGAFTEKYQEALKDLCANAVTGITAGKTEEEIRQIFDSTMVSMEMIPVTYRYDVNHIIQLISKLGLSQDSKLTLIRLNDIAALKQSIQDAIRSGGVIKGDVELLKTLEVVAAYRFKLESVTAPNAGDVFTIRLTIPADLGDYTGLQIAYYVETANGVTVEYIDSRIEGNEIVFETDRVGDFVILADSTVDLTAIIIALGAILCCQIIAIAAIMITRFNARKKISATKHYSLVLPAFLAVHFLPVGGEKLALLMGAGVILLQIVLMILLLKSDMIHLGKKKKQKPLGEEEAPINDAYSNAEAAAELPADVQETLEDSEETRIAAFLYENGSAEQQEGESDPYVDDPFAMYDEAEAPAEEDAELDLPAEGEESAAETLEEDFIEPAANPYYSLPEDEGEEAQETFYDEASDEAFDAEGAAWGEEPYAEEQYADEEYSEEYAEEDALEEAESFSLDDTFAEEYTANAEATEYDAEQEVTDYDTEAYANDYAEEEPYDESSFEDAYVSEFYGEEAPAEEAPYGEEAPYAEEEPYAEDPVFEAPVYEADEAEEETDPMYRYDE